MAQADGAPAARSSPGCGDSHDGETAPTLRKTFRHPMAGPVTVNCDALDLTDRDQQVVIYTAVPGTSSEEAQRLLSVIGTQRMDAPTEPGAPRPVICWPRTL